MSHVLTAYGRLTDAERKFISAVMRELHSDCRDVLGVNLAIPPDDTAWPDIAERIAQWIERTKLFGASHNGTNTEYQGTEVGHS